MRRAFLLSRTLEELFRSSQTRNRTSFLSSLKDQYGRRAHSRSQADTQLRHSLSPERAGGRAEGLGPILSVDKFRDFLLKMKTHSIHLINHMFRQYSRIFNREFKSFFRSKTNIFTKFYGDLEKKVKIKIASIFTNKNLILGFLDVPEGSFQATSLSAFFAKQAQPELLSRDFSSVVSMDNNFASDSLSLILEYSKSFIDDSDQSKSPETESPAHAPFDSDQSVPQELFADVGETMRRTANEISKEFDELRLSRIVQLSQRPSNADFSEVRKNLQILNSRVEAERPGQGEPRQQKIFGCGQFVYRSSQFGSKEGDEEEAEMREAVHTERKETPGARVDSRLSGRDAGPRAADVSNLMGASDDEGVGEAPPETVDTRKRSVKKRPREMSGSQRQSKSREKRAITKTLETVKRTTTNNLRKKTKRANSKRHSKKGKTGASDTQKNRTNLQAKEEVREKKQDRKRRVKREAQAKKSAASRRGSREKRGTEAGEKGGSRRASQRRQKRQKTRHEEERIKAHQKKKSLSILGFKTKKQSLQSVLKNKGRQSKFSCQTQKSSRNRRLQPHHEGPRELQQDVRDHRRRQAARRELQEAKTGPFRGRLRPARERLQN